MPEHGQFVSKWPEHPIGTSISIYYPEHLQDRTPHPEIRPQVLDIVARMFVPRPIINGDYKSTPFPNLPIELYRVIWLKSLPGPLILRSSAGSGMKMTSAVLIVRSQRRFLSTAKLARLHLSSASLGLLSWEPQQKSILTRKSTGASASRRHSLGRPGLSPLG